MNLQKFVEQDYFEALAAMGDFSQDCQDQCCSEGSRNRKLVYLGSRRSTRSKSTATS